VRCLAVLVVCAACISRSPVRSRGPIAAADAESADDEGGDVDGDADDDEESYWEPGSAAPEICRASSGPLDGHGRALLLALEQQLVEGIVTDRPGRRLFDTADHYQLLRDTPGDVAVVFPLRVQPSATPFVVHQVRSVDAARRLATTKPVYLVKLSDVRQLRVGDERALLVDYRSGPLGRPPGGGLWLWGAAGEFCVVPTRGGFRVFATGWSVISYSRSRDGRRSAETTRSVGSKPQDA
jgi:hypothetical protein